VKSILSLPIVKQQKNPLCCLLLPKTNITILLSGISTRVSASQDHAAAKEALNMEENSREIGIEYSRGAYDGKVCLQQAGHLILYLCIYMLGSRHINVLLVIRVGTLSLSLSFSSVEARSG
jgi:hypothetical protein